MNRKLIKLTPEKMRERMEYKGMTIHGTPLYVDQSYVREQQEIENDGIVLYHHIEQIFGLHVHTSGKVFFYCHPDLRGQIESQERRN